MKDWLINRESSLINLNFFKASEYKYDFAKKSINNQFFIFNNNFNSGETIEFNIISNHFKLENNSLLKYKL